MKPNIIFIFADQLRQSSLNHQVENVHTPNLDKFATESTTFTRAISNTPVCGPARASILTGLHTLSHQVVNNDLQLRTNVTTIANSLNSEGYTCGYIGKWHLDTNDRGVFIPSGPRRQGFDDYFAGYNCNHQYFQSYYYENDNETPIWNEGYEPFTQTKLAKNYIKKKTKQNKPFCLFLSFGPPHCPYKEVPQKYLDMYPEESITLKDNASKNADKSIIAGYYAHITALDECFGEIITSINEQGIRNDTIIVFTSDHGDMLFSQNRGWKCKPWNESVNIPFIINWPEKIKSDIRTKELFSLVDVMPTLLGLTKCEIPKEVQGKDLSKLLLGKDCELQDSVFINYPLSPDKFSFKEWRGIVTKQYTYARFKDKPWILYDDINNANQLYNLVDNKKYIKIQENLEKKLNNWLVTLHDSFDTTKQVCEKYMKGSIKGTIPYYDNDIIKNGKEIRRKNYNKN